jgi:hypothetical protein
VANDKWGDVWLLPSGLYVIEPPKLILYYRINLSSWSLHDNTELTRRLCRVNLGESRVAMTHIHTQNSHEGESRDYIIIDYITSTPLRVILLQTEFIA